ncbi:12541_t:CDS:2 [Funneliformis caledonium]|uniref:12541_t:CDS:1 n=1 Tax=Funneliformis caledonium TaxID=1117310 RepID=A0A9N9EJF3_9GLOM|nr:12541_t:CDS:2 [Funneliformis caledonium]
MTTLGCSKSSYNTYRRSSLKETNSNEASSSTSRDSSASRDSTTSSETASSVAKTR